MLEVVKVLGSLFIPFIEGAKVILVLIGISTLNSTLLVIDNPRIVNENGKYFLSFVLKNAVNDKFRTLLNSEIPGYLIYKIEVYLPNSSTNIFITNSAYYNLKDGEYKVFYNFVNPQTRKTKSISEVEDLLTKVKFEIPGFAPGNTTVRVSVYPSFDYEGMSGQNASELIWGTEFKVKITY